MFSSSTSKAQCKPSLVIVGNGMATGRLLDEIITRSPKRYTITVIGEEAQGSYNRILLSTVLAKETHYENIIQKTPQWYQDNDITFISSTRVTDIDRSTKTLTTETYHNDNFSDISRAQLQYDELVLAVGSRAATIPAKNQNIEGIFSFRNIRDTQNIESFSKNHKNAVVIGGGLLGLEAAYGLARTGVTVTLIHRNKWLLNRQLDLVAGDMLKKVMAEKNITFVLGEEVVRFDQLMNANNKASLSGIELTSGEYRKADIAIIATGITPNSELGDCCGLEVDKAIVVNDYMQTSDKHISALGECCQHKKSTFGLVDPIWKQCESLAIRLTSLHLQKFKNAPVATKLKVSGVQLFSAGIVESSAETQTYTLCDNNARVYRKLIIENNIIVGIVLFGDVSSGMDYFELMQNKTPVKMHMPELLLGAEYMLDEKIETENKVA
jgi:nitrite reductase (NADH) large subunit